MTVRGKSVQLQKNEPIVHTLIQIDVHWRKFVFRIAIFVTPIQRKRFHLLLLMLLRMRIFSPRCQRVSSSLKDEVKHEGVRKPVKSEIIGHTLRKQNKMKLASAEKINAMLEYLP